LEREIEPLKDGVRVKNRGMKERGNKPPEHKPESVSISDKSAVKLHENSITDIKITENLLITCGDDHKIKIYNLESRRVIEVVGHTGRVVDMEIANKYIFSVGGDMYLRAWKIENLEMVYERKVKIYNLSKVLVLGASNVYEVFVFGRGYESFRIEL
jgi:WD40 repeat protein